MPSALKRERTGVLTARQLADQAFSRAAGAPLMEGNAAHILKDAQENYPAWLYAIRSARKWVHFESYIIHDDEAGEQFAEALIEKARQDVPVRLIYDWLGGLGKTSPSFWRRLLKGGVDVRCYNPPRPDSPLGWVSRDHRKMLSVDGEIAFVTGLCVGRMWVGYPERGIAPWRDTGVEVRGPAVADIEEAFAQVWAATGGSPLDSTASLEGTIAPAGDMALRIVATVPNTAGLFRLDQLIAAMARKRLWLTDAYYAGTASFVQALRGAAKDGVDVRLLVPNGTDIAILRPLSRAGYRPLLEAGVRVFEWTGPMLHAKTAVTDGIWSRVGSTNLNIASWMGNYELDVMVEDERFASAMEQMYLDDLDNATEVVLDERSRLRVPGQVAPPAMRRGRGSAGRAAAGAIRIGNTIGAAISNRRVLEPIEGRLMVTSGFLLLGLALLFWFFPSSLGYFFAVLAVWFGLAFVYRGSRLLREARNKRE
ncbi:MAG: phosphatidylserine/phosphatidylglycerophosphate/cardiolipin synthase family protein [Candidatus Korobacteraceae bacterium]